MNRAYWALPGVKGTVWERYMLVASQWPTVTQPPGPQNDGTYFPGLTLDPDTPREPYQSSDAAADPNENLVNTTIETYLQEAPSSCMACHHAVSNARGRDFVGILEAMDGLPVTVRRQVVGLVNAPGGFAEILGELPGTELAESLDAAPEFDVIVFFVTWRAELEAELGRLRRRMAPARMELPLPPRPRGWCRCGCRPRCAPRGAPSPCRCATSAATRPLSHPAS